MNVEHEKKWMVVYTRSKWEKRSHYLLGMQGIESFCPLISTRRKWADRVKIVTLPLFNSYLFVHITAKQKLQVLETGGVVNFVNYCQQPAIVPAADIARIRTVIDEYDGVELLSIKQLITGQQVKFKDGIFFDLTGEVLEVQGKSILVMLKQLDCALVAKVKVNINDFS